MTKKRTDFTNTDEELCFEDVKKTNKHMFALRCDALGVVGGGLARGLGWLAVGGDDDEVAWAGGEARNVGVEGLVELGGLSRRVLGRVVVAELVRPVEAVQLLLGPCEKSRGGGGVGREGQGMARGGRICCWARS